MDRPAHQGWASHPLSTTLGWKGRRFPRLGSTVCIIVVRRLKPPRRPTVGSGRNREDVHQRSRVRSARPHSLSSHLAEPPRPERERAWLGRIFSLFDPDRTTTCCRANACCKRSFGALNPLDALSESGFPVGANACRDHHDFESRPIDQKRTWWSGRWPPSTLFSAVPPAPRHQVVGA